MAGSKPEHVSPPDSSGGRSSNTDHVEGGAVPLPVVFFDGECGLCNRAVDRILRADHAGEFRFAPLQGETAKRLLPAPPADREQWTLFLFDDDGIHDRSEAALRIARRLGGRWAVLAWLRIVPRFVRDPVYRFIARNRYRWFGRNDACRIPTAAERGRFLP